MEPIVLQITYYICVYAIAFAAGACRKLRDCRNSNFGYVARVGAVAGFTGFTVVALLNSNGFVSGVGGLAVASLVGLTGREVTDLMLGRLIENFMPRAEKPKRKK